MWIPSKDENEGRVGQTQRSVQDEGRAGNRVHVARALVRGGRLRQA